MDSSIVATSRRSITRVFTLRFFFLNSKALGTRTPSRRHERTHVYKHYAHAATVPAGQHVRAPCLHTVNSVRDIALAVGLAFQLDDTHSSENGKRACGCSLAQLVGKSDVRPACRQAANDDLSYPRAGPHNHPAAAAWACLSNPPNRWLAHVTCMWVSGQIIACLICFAVNITHG
jgi:hypothetical protein